MLLYSAAYAATTVDFYATVSSSDDENMIKMTTDLFYSQFLSINGYAVNDRRDTAYPPQTPSPNIAFYAEIQEDSNGSWICTLNAIDSSREKSVNATKKYASYYKILLDAKASLENLLKNLSTGGSGTAEESTAQEPAQTAVPSEPDTEKQTSPIEQLAGTWNGEDHIEKILILRSGRGFVIFENGASMNISVEEAGGSVKITQTSRPNASFFPELPRALALKNAAQSQPVEWNLTLAEDGSLKGSKTTLVESRSSDTGVSRETVAVEWKRR